MARRYESDRDWLAEHLKTLMDIGRQVQESDQERQVGRPLPTYDKGAWTGLKLICLAYYLPTYINILRKKRRLAYVDLFSGPGLNLVGDSSVPLPGSPLIALEHPRVAHGFDSYILCDKNKEYVEALRSRAARFLEGENPRIMNDQIEFHCMDANDMATKVPGILKEQAIDHALFFIDPEGLEFKWKAVTHLAEKCPFSDWIMLFPSSGIPRLLGREDSAARNLIEEYFGPGNETLVPGTSEESLVSLYRGNLANLGKDVSTEIMVASAGPFHYHLIPAVRSTDTGSPWFDSFREVKRRVESLGGNVLTLVAQQIEGRLGMLPV